MQDNQEDRRSRFQWIKKLPSNKGTSSVVGVLGLTSGIALTVFDPLIGTGAYITGISLTTLGTICAMNYSRIKIGEMLSFNQETSKKIDDVQSEDMNMDLVINKPKYSNSDSALNNINETIQLISAGLVLGGSFFSASASAINTFDKDSNENLVLGLGIAGGLLVTAGMICGVFSHSYLAGILAKRRGDLQSCENYLKDQLDERLREIYNASKQELEDVKKKFKELKDSSLENESMLKGNLISLEEKLNECEKYLTCAQDEKEKLNKQISDLSQMKDNMQSLHDQLLLEKNKLAEEISNKDIQINEQAQTIKKANMIIVDKDEIIKNLKSSYAILEERFNEKKSETEIIEDKLDSTENFLTRMEAALEKITRSSELLSEQLKLANEKVDVLQECNTTLEEKVKSLTTENESLKSQKP